MFQHKVEGNADSLSKIIALQSCVAAAETRARCIVVVSLSTIGAVAGVICALLQRSQLNVQSWRHLDSNPLGESPSVDDPYWRAWLQESGIHVSAIVIYGRKRYVRVLDGYLNRNLVSAGGLLEEVRAQCAQNLCIGTVMMSPYLAATAQRACRYYGWCKRIMQQTYSGCRKCCHQAGPSPIKQFGQQASSECTYRRAFNT